MSDAIVRALVRGQASGQPLPVLVGYCSSTAPRLVQITGAIELEGLEYLGPAGSLVVGRVLLLRIPDGRPIILGNLNA